MVNLGIKPQLGSKIGFFLISAPILSIWGSLSDGMIGVIYRDHEQSYSHLQLLFCMLAFQPVVRSKAPYGQILFTVLYVTVVHTQYVQYIQRLCQSVLGTADTGAVHLYKIGTDSK
jgi:hypothetical protein